MEQAGNIIQGWKNYLKKTDDNQTRERANICKNCPNAVIGTVIKLLPEYKLKEIQGLKCNHCGCPLSAKLRSKKEKCPIGKW